MKLVATATTVTLDYEEVARRAQVFLADRPVLVLGTGATIPHGLPSMGDLAESLVAEVKDAPPGWEEFTERLRESGDLERTLQDITLPSGTLETIIRSTWEIVSRRDLEFHRALINGGIKFPLADMFRYLLRTADAHIRVVTTNYDRVAEYASNYVNAYASTGVSPGWIQRFVPTSVNNERPPSPGFEGRVSILKVHGSLDWFNDAVGEIMSVPFAASIPDNAQPLVVTPGVSKYREVHKDPFRTVMSAADVVLREATCYVCVGYGFNDDHVQPILVNRVNREDVPLLVLSRTLTEQTRVSFLRNPPKKFLFLEQGNDGTTVYAPEHPEGTPLAGTSVWELENFMNLVSGEGAR